MTKLFTAAALALVAVAVIPAQEKEDRTLLSTTQMLAIINEASGERAMHHVLELVPYQRVRLPEEYKGHFPEREVMARLAREDGVSNVAMESFAKGEAWQPVVGELWTTAPRPIKLYDVHDMALALASLNANMDASGDLVDIGLGRAQDFEGKDVAG